MLVVRFLIVALAISTLELHANSAPKIDVKRLYKADWYELESDHFVLTTNLNEKKAKQMAVELEEFYYFVSVGLRFEQKAHQEKINFIATKSKKDFKALGFNSNVAGMFVQRGDEYALFANAKRFKASSTGKANDGRQTVLHEITHLVMRNAKYVDGIPYWYSEGIAEYFGTYVRKGNKIILGNLKLVENRFHSMKSRSGNYTGYDIEGMLKQTKRGGMTVREVDAFYGRSFLFVHYLNADPFRKKQLRGFLTVLDEGYPIDLCFREVFQMKYEDMDVIMMDYLKSSHVYARTFIVGKGDDEVHFPEFKIKLTKLDKREALETLLSAVHLRMFGSIGLSNPEGVFDGVLKYYPNFFDPALNEN